MTVTATTIVMIILARRTLFFDPLVTAPPSPWLDLATHPVMDIHEKIPFPKYHFCQFCNYRSHLKGNLKRHLRTHTGEMPYSCNFCSFRSSDQTTMRRHKTRHTRHLLPPLPPC
ncbi:Zinc finger and BTB domain-containing protein 8B [Armadillidium vulgare]|nr:Zinc finger and BTB domain-containing protein 8B [Armadillidium vulgare]